MLSDNKALTINIKLDGYEEVNKQLDDIEKKLVRINELASKNIDIIRPVNPVIEGLNLEEENIITFLRRIERHLRLAIKKN